MLAIPLDWTPQKCINDPIVIDYPHEMLLSIVMGKHPFRHHPNFRWRDFPWKPSSELELPPFSELETPIFFTIINHQYESHNHHKNPHLPSTYHKKYHQSAALPVMFPRERCSSGSPQQRSFASGAASEQGKSLGWQQLELGVQKWWWYGG